MPASGQAKVVFVRPSPTGRGAATTFRLHEGETLLGILPHKSYFDYREKYLSSPNRAQVLPEYGLSKPLGTN